MRKKIEVNLCKRDVVSVNIIVDESGSMASRKRQVISGVNEYLDELRNNNDVDYRVNIVKFAYNSKILNEDMPLAEVGKFTDYKPDGGTALIDAVGDAITAVDRSLSKVNLKTAIFLILTDGEENSSHRFTTYQVKSMIEDRQTKGWVFTYMGADANAWDASSAIGISKNNTWVWNPAYTVGTFAANAQATSCYTANMCRGAQIDNMSFYKSAGIDDVGILAETLDESNKVSTKP